MKELTMYIENIIEDYMCEYGSYIITNRALPSEFDGLKPVHRRILYTMWLEKAFRLTKSQNIDGQTLKIHPHGSVYGTIVNMVLKDRNNIPYIQGKGSFGLFTSKTLEASAPRYTEIKLSPFAQKMLKETNENIIDFIPNYDGTIQVPSQLSTKIPTILINPNSGIALGMSSCFGSFNIKELKLAMEKYINTGEQTVLIPDFATECDIIKNEPIFESINNNGFGSIKMRAKHQIEGREITFTCLPYDSKVENIIDKIRALNKTGRLKEVSGVLNLTGLGGMKLEVTAKKGTDMKILVEKLYQLTELEGSFSFNMNLIDKDGFPVVKGVWEIIKDWIVWRKENISKYYKYEIKKYEDDIQFLELMIKIIKDKTETIDTLIKNKKKEAISIVSEKYNADKKLTERCLKTEMFNLNEEYFKENIDKLNKLNKLIESYNDIINNDSKKNEIIIKDLEEMLKDFDVSRKSNIIELDTVALKKLKTVIKKKEEAIDKTPKMMYITRDGYIKKLSKDCTPEVNKFKENDYIIKKIVVDDTNEILIFSGSDCYKVNVKDIPMCKPTEFGYYIKTTIGDVDIKQVGILSDEYKYMLVGYASGQIAKIEMDSYKTKTNRTKLANSCLDEPMTFVIELTGDKDVTITTSKREVKFNTTKLTLKSSRGTKGTKIYNGEKLSFQDIEIS